MIYLRCWLANLFTANLISTRVNPIACARKPCSEIYLMPYAPDWVALVTLLKKVPLQVYRGATLARPPLIHMIAPRNTSIFMSHNFGNNGLLDALAVCLHLHGISFVTSFDSGMVLACAPGIRPATGLIRFLLVCARPFAILIRPGASARGVRRLDNLDDKVGHSQLDLKLQKICHGVKLKISVTR
jgi:hypothetical protein